jgi:hypothetical protein
VIVGQGLARRRLIEETLGGLRFVRNRIGDEADLAEFIQSSAWPWCYPRSSAWSGRSGAWRAGHGTAEAPITAWTWKLVPQPASGLLTPRGRAWEVTRYRAYLARLAGHPIGETFGCAAAFLTMAAARIPMATDDAARASLLAALSRFARDPGREGGQPAGA